MANTHDPIVPHDDSDRRVAVVDVGSNTCRLVVFRVLADGSYYLEDEIREVVRLRAGMTNGQLRPDAVERAVAVLHLFRRFCDSVGASEVLPVATSAVREAFNAAALLDRVHEVTGWTLEVLSEEEEARQGAVGVLADVPVTDGWILDVGGGSAQLSRVKRGRWERGVSLPLGALRLTERHLPEDPPTPESMDSLCSAIREVLASSGFKRPKHGALVGTGGTIRNLGYIEHARRAWPFRSLRGLTLDASTVGSLVEELGSRTSAKRARIKGMNPDRADIVVAGALVLQETMAWLRADACHLSVLGLREGVFLTHVLGEDSARSRAQLRGFGVHNLASRFRYHRTHSERVQSLALQLFDGFRGMHGLEPAFRDVLSAAALLHDIGTIIGYHDHHKHGQMLVAQHGLPGFSGRESALIGLLVRYHRKGNPTPGVFRSVLDNGDRKALRWTAAMLRVAEYLERGRNGNVRSVRVVDWGKRGVQLVVEGGADMSVELWDTERRALPLLERVTGRRVTLLGLAVPNGAPLDRTAGKD